MSNIDISNEDKKTLDKINNGSLLIPDCKTEKMDFKVNYYKFKYQIEKNNVFTLDKNNSIVFEQAYGIYFDGKNYHLNIYLPDVITFLSDNPKVFEKAYERGETLYHSTGRFDMIPYPNIIDHLSFKTHSSRNAIKFSFVINKKGKLISYDIYPVYIKLTKHIKESYAQKIINGINEDEGNILLLKELIDLVNEKNDYGTKRAKDLISFPSVYLNQFVSDRCKYLIFFDGVNYTSNPTNYASISTPLRKIVADINLAVFLNHIGCFRLSDYDYNYYFNHKDEIVKHLNERRELATFIKKYPSFRIDK